MSNENQPPPGLSRLLQFAAGLAAGCVAALLILLLAFTGVPVGTAAWVGVFLAVWAAVFTLQRFKLPWVVTGFGVGLAAAYLVLAARMGF